MKQRQRRLAPKVYQLASDLGKLATEIGPGGKLPTVLDLCKQFGVSISTVHGALAELETQNIIERRHGVGLYVSAKLYCKNIRVLINATLVGSPGATTSPFWGLLFAHLVEEGQRRRGYRNEEVQYQLVPDGALPNNVRKEIDAGHIHGCITVGIHGEPTLLLTEARIPTVTYAGDGTCFVFTDSEEAVGSCVAQLAARGCKRIGFWIEFIDELRGVNLRQYYSLHLERVARWTSACGLQSYPDLNRIGVLTQAELERGDYSIHPHTNPGGYYYDQGFQSAMETFHAPREEWPDALVILTDTMTHGVLRVMWSLGLFPGKDIRIASHANIGSPILHGWNDELLLWHVDPAKIARSMFEFLDDVMASGQPSHEARVVRSVPPTLAMHDR